MSPYLKPMSILKSVLLLSGIAFGAVLPPRAPVQDTPDGFCCFTLHDASTGKILQQNQDSGNVYVSSSQSSGWYCLDLSDSQGVLRDEWNNACIISIQDRFSCLDPTIGGVTWGLDDSDGSVLLTHDGRLDYTAKTAKIGGQQIWGDRTTGGRKMQLEAKDFDGACQGLGN